MLPAIEAPLTCEASRLSGGAKILNHESENFELRLEHDGSFVIFF
jgi:hypothetical protein